MPAWAHPEVFSDPSGGPHESALLPIGPVWRGLFGSSRPLPLWLGYTPGNLFAVSRTAVLEPRLFPHATPAAAGAPVPREAPSVFYTRAASVCGLDGRREPIAAEALERLWRYVFVPADADDA